MYCWEQHTGEFAPNGLENFGAITLSQVTSLPTSFRSTIKPFDSRLVRISTSSVPVM